MDAQSKMVLERVLALWGTGKKEKDPIGGEWSEESSFWAVKCLSGTQKGLWGELMFEESFGYKSEQVGLDLPDLKSDVKVMTRSKSKTKFASDASCDMNPEWYYIYLVFPEEYQLYRIPSSYRAVSQPTFTNLKGKIDIMRSHIIEMENNKWRFCDNRNRPEDIFFKKNNLEKFFEN